MSSILWHDYETFGVDPALDRPSQFAAIRTNLDLELVAEPLMIYCSPQPDMLPSIDACLITGITPQEAAEKGVSEPEFIAKIHSEFIQPNTCGAGYNSIRFDDEVTRHCLYRNFYDPYAREWQNGNSRWDIIDMVRATYALRPEGIHWPESEPGIPSFRLELLTEANGLDHGAAHDALSDVYATIAMAKLIREKQPRLYEYLWSMRDKHRVSGMLDLTQRKPLLHVSSKIPASRACTTVIMPFIKHPKNSNGVVCIDLTVSPESWIDLTVDEMADRLYKKTEELKLDEVRLPLKTVHLNRSPVLGPLSLLDKQSQARLNIDLQVCEENWQTLLSQPELAKKLKSLFDTDFEQSKDVEASLYNGFIPSSDRALCDQIISADLAELESSTFAFSDERLKELFFRYKARHYPEILSSDERGIWLEEVRSRYFNSTTGEPSIVDEYMSDLNARIAKSNPERAASILKRLKEWMLDFQKHYSKA